MIAVSAAILLLSGIALWQTANLARSLSLGQIETTSKNTLDLIVENLRGDLDKFRYLPRVLADDLQLRLALRGQVSKAGLQAVNEELERINNVAGASDVYLMDQHGVTIAASNWASNKSFIGRNFSYRPYFQEAMEGRLGRYFALGTTSGERGYYFAQPVRDQTTILGAVVIKLQLDRHELAWDTPGQEVLVVDRDGVVFMSSRPDWTFGTLTPLEETALQEIKLTRRYGNEPLLPINAQLEKRNGWTFLLHKEQGTGDERPVNQYLVVEKTMADADWQVLLLAPTLSVQRDMLVAVATMAFVIVILILSIALVYQRRQRMSERLRFQTETNALLELRVEERTNELTETNTALRNEIMEKIKAQEQAEQAQSELAQASKLAALGKMSAGISHELNQPLAAIRSYADNAGRFLERGRDDVAKDNLKGIAELTERMAKIIRNLRTFARNETVALRPTSLKKSIEESRILLADRFQETGTLFELVGLDDDTVNVIAGEVRLQQVFINLFSNAIDAMADVKRRKITVSVRDRHDMVEVQVRDCGPGIERDQFDVLFDPFYSTKEVGAGMGLGLSITYGLVKQFGGRIEAGNGADGGAVFRLDLHRAQMQKGAAQ